MEAGGVAVSVYNSLVIDEGAEDCTVPFHSLFVLGAVEKIFTGLLLSVKVVKVELSTGTH
jgi:hypothetical protein